MEKQEVKFYEGNEVTFQLGEDVMINATQMAKPFNKVVGEWFRLESTKKLLPVLEESTTLFNRSLVEKKNGVGTWMHKDVALEFARWLNPKFAIWFKARVGELTTAEITATQPTLDQMLDDPDTLIRALTRLKQERIKKGRAQLELIEYKKEVTPELHALRMLTDNGTSSEMGEAVKIIFSDSGFTVGRNKFFEMLRKDGVLMQDGESRNLPYQQYINQGYFVVKQGLRELSSGRSMVFATTYVTPKGLRWLTKRYRPVAAG